MEIGRTAAAWNSPEHVRFLMSRDIAGPRYLDEALRSVPPEQRDAWWDRFVYQTPTSDVILPDDSEDLPRGSAPYLPCSVETAWVAFRSVNLCAEDVFIDVGSGTGRVALLAHFLTGAGAIGVEIQSHLAMQGKNLAARLQRSRVATVEGDASELLWYLPLGTVYFLYCPFGGKPLADVLLTLKEQARVRKIRVCLIDMPPLEVPWLRDLGAAHPSIQAFESVFS